MNLELITDIIRRRYMDNIDCYILKKHGNVSSSYISNVTLCDSMIDFNLEVEYSYFNDNDDAFSDVLSISLRELLKDNCHLDSFIKDEIDELLEL